MDTHFSPVSPLDQNEETAGGAAADFACRHDRDRQCAAVGSRRSSSRSDGSGVARSVKQKGPNGVAISDSEAATPNSGRHIIDHPTTHGPMLPSSASLTIREWARIIHNESIGNYELHDLKPVASVITHELLTEASDAVANLSLPISGRDRRRLLARLTATVVGGAFDADDDLALTVGKRLGRQADRVNAALDAIAERSQKSRSSAQHFAHRYPWDDNVNTMHGLLELYREEATMEVLKTQTEIYVGFNELSLPVGTADEPPPLPAAPHASTRAASSRDMTPAVTLYERSASPGRPYDPEMIILHRKWAYREGQMDTYWNGHDDGEMYFEWRQAERVRKLDEKEKELREFELHCAQRLGEANNKLIQSLDNRSTLSEARMAIREELEAKHEQRVEGLVISISNLDDEVESLTLQLAASQAREEALRGVIKDNILRLREGSV